MKLIITMSRRFGTGASIIANAVSYTHLDVYKRQDFFLSGSRRRLHSVSPWRMPAPAVR